jgi:hypothetical protein
MIGIKVADGAFFPVLAENTVARKRLVLTTAHDAQTSVQIDFYRASSVSMQDAFYIGTLLIENIQKKKKGGPSIELVISLDADGEFSASAYDLDHPEDQNNHVLTVSLSQQEYLDNLDDIDFAHEYVIPKDEAYDKYAANIKASKIKPIVIIISAVVLLALAVCGLWFFVFRSLFEGEGGGAPPENPAAEAVLETPPAPPPPPQVAAGEQEAPLIKAPDIPVKADVRMPRKRNPAPVSSYKVPPVIPAGGVSYKLRWGDTLWDVSQAFYRTPWRYKYLANHNGIRNPNRIIAGRTIKIPPLPK